MIEVNSLPEQDEEKLPWVQFCSPLLLFVISLFIQKDFAALFSGVTITALVLTLFPETQNFNFKKRWATAILSGLVAFSSAELGMGIVWAWSNN